jgi:N-methylhydantoinase B
VDPATLEIVHGKLMACVDEMGIITARTSMSPVIYEVLDFACGVCRADGDLVAQANGITLFTGTFSDQVRFIKERFDGEMQPGDSFVTNDPYRGGTHACDMAIVTPLFHDGRVVAYAINVAHWLDVGGAVPGSLPPDATSVFQEGLRLPGFRVTRDDRILPEIERLIAENVRLPLLALADLRAQLASTRRAAARVAEIIADYGLGTFEDCCEAILNDAERRSRAALEALPDGEFEATDVIDGDGVSDAPIPVRCRVTKRGNSLSVDFTGTAPTAAGPVNCAAGATRSAVKTVFKALVGPQDPSNEGWFRPLDIVLPPRTVFSAEKPSPTGWYYEGSVHASELVWKALAPVAPERFPAGSYASLCVTYITGRDAHGEEFVHIEPQHGGWGACRDRDGSSGLISLTDGDTFNYSVELIEAKFPLFVERYGFNTEAGAGAGRHRGGYGLVRDYRVLAGQAWGYCGFGRTATPPWGVDGGRDGSLNALRIREPSGATRLTLSRCARFDLSPGDVVAIATGGGGGWGDPAGRDAAAVARDVEDGLLSPEDADRLYGSGEGGR